MKNKLLLTLCLLGWKAMAMEAMELPKENRQVQPSNISKSIVIIQGQEKELPDRLVELSGTLRSLIEDLRGNDEKSGIPTLAISLATLNHIETQIESIYNYTQGNIEAKNAIIANYSKLDSRSLIDLIYAAEYLDIPLLSEIALELAHNLTADELAWLPAARRNEIVKSKMSSMLGTVMLKKIGHIHHGRQEKRYSKPWPKSLLNIVCATQDNKIVSGSEDGTIRIWDTSGNQLTAFRGLNINGRDYRVDLLCVTSDNKIVCCGSTPPPAGKAINLQVLDMAGNQLTAWEIPYLITSLCVTRDNKIVSGHPSGTVRIWDMVGTQLTILRGLPGDVISVCATDDKKIIAGSQCEVYVYICDVMSNQLVQLATCRGHTKPVTSVCIAHDNKKIVSASYNDKTVRIWDMTGNPLAICEIEDYVSSVCPTHDNKIISGTRDGKVLVLDMAGNKLAGCMHKGGISSVHVTTDNKIVTFNEYLRLYEIRIHKEDAEALSIWDVSLLQYFSDMNLEQAQAIHKILQPPLEEDEQMDVWKERRWKEIWNVFEEKSHSAKTLQVLLLVSVPIYIVLKFLRST